MIDTSENNVKEFRQKAISFYKNNLQGKTVFHAALGEIKFTGKGIHKTRNASADIRKLKSIYILPELILNAKLEKTLDSYKNRNDGPKKFHYLTGNTKIDNEFFEYRIIFIEDDFGIKYYDLYDKNATY